jgi:hypothetical protein
MSFDYCFTAAQYSNIKITVKALNQLGGGGLKFNAHTHVRE